MPVTSADAASAAGSGVYELGSGPVVSRVSIDDGRAGLCCSSSIRSSGIELNQTGNDEELGKLLQNNCFPSVFLKSSGETRIVSRVFFYKALGK
jgi:hypothetical protein